MSNISLYKAVDELREILDHVDPETGELPKEYGDVMGLVKNKAASVAAYYLSQEVSADAAEAHAKKIAAKVSRIRKQNEWLKIYLGQNMKAAGIRKITGEAGLEVKFHPERDPAIEIFDERQVPDQFWVEPPPPKKVISKKLIGDYLKVPVAEGEKPRQVAGALMVKRDRVEIKP